MAIDGWPLELELAARIVGRSALLDDRGRACGARAKKRVGRRNEAVEIEPGCTYQH